LLSENKIMLIGVNSSISAGKTDPQGFGEFLENRGILVDSPEGIGKKLVCIDYAGGAWRKISQLGLADSGATLVRMEPKVVLPANFARGRSRQFEKIITLGGIPGQADNGLPWPQNWPAQFSFSDPERKSRLERAVLVNSHKISLIKGELYSLRRASLLQIKEIDLYGPGWESPISIQIIKLLKAFMFAILNLQFPQIQSMRWWFRKFKNWQGVAPEKVEIMSNYKYALVIENSHEYMSEKLFDAFFAGCIPVYVGPPVEKFGIPKELVFQAEPNLESISRALHQAKLKDYEDYLRSLKKYLESPETFTLWNRESVYSRILEIIQQ